MSGPALPLLGDVVRYTIAPIASRLMWPLLMRKIFFPAAVPAKFRRFPKEMAVRPSQIRAETVKAKRQDADRILNADEAEGAFEEKTVEMMGTKEESEVQKEARVGGEVELTKENKQRQKTISDTVRKTDVEVEEVGASSKK